MELYRSKRFFGPHDLALVRTRRRIVFSPGRVEPVSYFLVCLRFRCGCQLVFLYKVTQNKIFHHHILQICLGKVRDQPRNPKRTLNAFVVGLSLSHILFNHPPFSSSLPQNILGWGQAGSGKSFGVHCWTKNKGPRPYHRSHILMSTTICHFSSYHSCHPTHPQLY